MWRQADLSRALRQGQLALILKGGEAQLQMRLQGILVANAVPELERINHRCVLLIGVDR